MMGTFMKGAFIVGLAAFNWAQAAPVITSSSQSAEAYPDYGSYDAPVIVSGNSQNIAMLQTIKSETVLYDYLSKSNDPVLMNTWQITHDLMVEGILNQSVANQKTEIALLEALCKSAKNCVLPQS